MRHVTPQNSPMNFLFKSNRNMQSIKLSWLCMWLTHVRKIVGSYCIPIQYKQDVLTCQRRLVFMIGSFSYHLVFVLRTSQKLTPFCWYPVDLQLLVFLSMASPPGWIQSAQVIHLKILSLIFHTCSCINYHGNIS